MSTEIPLKELPKLVWELKMSDDLFCKKIIQNGDKLWIHYGNNLASILETDEPGPNTLFVASMKNVGILSLDRSSKTLYLSQPITHGNITFNKVNLSNFDSFKEHMTNQTQLICNFFEWSELNTVDTGLSENNAWSTLMGS